MNEITREKKGTERERSIVCREGKSPEFRRGCNLHLSFVFPLFRSMRFFPLKEITREIKSTVRERSLVCLEGQFPEFRRGCNLFLFFVFPLFRSMRFLTFSKITREKKEEPGRDPTPV